MGCLGGGNREGRRRIHRKMKSPSTKLLLYVHASTRPYIPVHCITQREEKNYTEKRETETNKLKKKKKEKEEEKKKKKKKNGYRYSLNFKHSFLKFIHEQKMYVHIIDKSSQSPPYT